MTADIHHFGADPDVRAERRIAVAHRLVEMNLEVAEAVQQLALAQLRRQTEAAESADAPAPTGRAPDPMAAVERAGRSVRLSLALAARLDGDEPVRKARARDEAAALREAQAEDRRRAEAAAQQAERLEAAQREADVFEVVEATLKATLKANGLDAETLEARVVEINERMWEWEREYDYLERPIGAVIATICEDFDIKPDWSLWADQDWAIAEARTAAPGSPYAPGGAARVTAGGAAAQAGPAEERVCEPVAADGSSP